MRLVHRPVDGEPTALATTIDIADSPWSRARGLMFRRSVPDDYALVFEFGTTKRLDVHMLFVFVPIDVIWTDDEVVQRVDRLHPWRSVALETGDRLIELPAGGATGVEVGDRLVLEDDSGSLSSSD